MLCEDYHHCSLHFTGSSPTDRLILTRLSLLALSSLSLFLFTTHMLLILFLHNLCQQALFLRRVNSIPSPLSRSLISKPKGFSCSSCNWERFMACSSVCSFQIHWTDKRFTCCHSANHAYFPVYLFSRFSYFN